MISIEITSCNMGRGAYDITGVPKPPPPKPRGTIGIDDISNLSFQKLSIHMYINIIKYNI